VRDIVEDALSEGAENTEYPTSTGVPQTKLRTLHDARLLCSVDSVQSWHTSASR